MFYSVEWQLVEERIDIESPFDGGTDIDKHMQYVWGTRYIDDIAMRRLDADKNGSYTDTGGGDKIYYHCTDAMFSTVAVLNSTDAKVLERVSYDAYGKARHHRAADMNADGRVNNSDYLVVVGGWGSFPNQGDVNRDGVVNTPDLHLLIGTWGSGLAPGKLSTTDNVIGWDGYVFNAELGEGGLYSVRNRNYRPELGRWAERDRLEYVDGMNMYQYVGGDPILSKDPEGLQLGGPIPPTSLVPEGYRCGAEKLRKCRENKALQRALEYVESVCPKAKCSTWSVICVRGLKGAKGKTQCQKCRIVIPPGASCGTLAHEFIHAGDHCANPGRCAEEGGFADCATQLCSEMRAVSYGCCGDRRGSSGECIRAELQSIREKTECGKRASPEQWEALKRCCTIEKPCNDLIREPVPSIPDARQCLRDAGCAPPE